MQAAQAAALACQSSAAVCLAGPWLGPMHVQHGMSMVKPWSDRYTYPKLDGRLAWHICCMLYSSRRALKTACDQYRGAVHGRACAALLAGVRGMTAVQAHSQQTHQGWCRTSASICSILIGSWVMYTRHTELHSPPASAPVAVHASHASCICMCCMLHQAKVRARFCCRAMCCTACGSAVDSCVPWQALQCHCCCLHTSEQQHRP